MICIQYKELKHILTEILKDFITIIIILSDLHLHLGCFYHNVSFRKVIILIIIE